ncbi:MAG: peptidase [Chloroflexota bacterium]
MPRQLLERFLRYVQIDTTSDPDSEAYPSTVKQWELLRLLASELEEIGAKVNLTPHGYVIADVPATVGCEAVPVVALLAHADTAPDFSGTNVKPIVHRNYQGGALRLPDDAEQVIDPADARYADLLTAVGKDVVTASGKTLLGADDKAGVAILVTLVARLLAEPGLAHGRVRICITPDEEVGRGVDNLDLNELGAAVAYTIDGGAVGRISWETFSADGAVITIRGVSTHPGEARRYGMVNAVHLAGKLLALLPRESASPEATDARQGFIHPLRINGNAAECSVHLILRDHENALLAGKGAALRAMCAAVEAAHPGARIDCAVTPQYRNMGYWLRDNMLAVELLRAACLEVGVLAVDDPVRGGTDGSRLTERGLPTPNIFTGGHNAHGPLEWVAVQDMQIVVDVLVALVRKWVEGGSGFTGYRSTADA